MGQRVVAVTIKGEMGTQLQAAFEDVDLTIEHGVTRLRVTCRDSSELHGILDRLDSLDLELLDVHAIEERPQS